MIFSKVDKTQRGWLVGSWEGALVKRDNVEFGVKRFKAGENEKSHVHNKSNETNVIVAGECKFNDKQFTSGDIVIVESGEAVRFLALTDCIIAVIRDNSVPDDKTFIEEPVKNDYTIADIIPYNNVETTNVAPKKTYKAGKNK